MQDRLLNGYLAGAVEQAVFQAKAADLKREIAQVEEALERATLCGPDAPARALALFDFSQKLVDVYLAERPFLKDGRGDWRSFEPYPQLIAPIVTVFEGPALPFVTTAERLLRLCA